jgi:YVTN family beta-propeller protein
MKIALTSLLLLATLLGLPATQHIETPPNALLVLSKTDQMLAIVDPATLVVINRIPVGNDPHEVIASSDGKFAYVSNYGGGAYNTLAVVDLVAQKALPSIDLGALRGPHGLVFAGGKVWFTAEAARAIGSYDPATKTVDWIFGTGQNRTHMIFVWPDLKRIATTNVSAATVSIIEKMAGAGPGRGNPPPNAPPRGAPGGDWNQTVIPVGRGAEGFDVSPDGKEIWVANAGDGSISVIEVATKTVTQTIAAEATSANRLKFTPNGKYVFVAGEAGADGAAITVIDAATRKVTKRITVGRGAEGIQMQPDGARVFVACSPDNNIAVIDLTTFAVVGRIEAGGNPDGLAWATRH